MTGRKNNTDDMKRQGQHKRQAQIWTDMDKTDKSVQAFQLLISQINFNHSIIHLYS